MPVAALNPEQAREFLDDYCNGYLLRDFIDLYSEKSPRLVSKILVRLAYCAGSEVTYDGLARDIGASRNTIEDYVLKLEECSIIRICPSFSRNLANELKKGSQDLFLRQRRAQCADSQFFSDGFPRKCGCPVGKLLFHGARQTARHAA